VSKVLYIDSETGGTKPSINPILTLACLVEIDGDLKDERLFQIRPFADQHIEPEALRINGLVMSDILNYPLPGKAHQDLTDWLGQYVDKFDSADKFFVAGYKVEFDMKFVRVLFEKVEDPYLGSWVNGRKINPLPVLEWMLWRGDLVLPNLKLETVCAHFGIPLEKAHDAMADIKATRQLIRVVDDLVFSRKERE